MGDYQASRDFGYCLSFAMRAAQSRSSLTLDVRDLLAGLFIANLEKLSRYWRDWENFEELAATECGVCEPRWFYWIQFYNETHGFEEDRDRKKGLFKDQSVDLARVWVTAGQIADARGVPAPGSRAILAPEDFLLAIVRHQETVLGAKLAASGLDIERLEQAVKTLKPRPG
jgi:hypothetical protein